MIYTCCWRRIININKDSNRLAGKEDYANKEDYTNNINQATDEDKDKDDYKGDDQADNRAYDNPCQGNTRL